MAVVAMAAITGGVMAVAVAVMAAAMAMAPGKGSKENPKKSSPQKKRGFPSGLLTQKGAQMGVTKAPLNASPAQKGQRDIKQRAAYPLPENGDRARTGREAGPKRENRQGVL